MIYKIISNKYDERYKNKQLQGVESFILDFIRKNSFEKILEVGCGTGHWLKCIENQNPKVYGCDLTLEMLNVAKEKKLNKIFACNAEMLSIKKKSFDLIFVVNALHHFPHKEKFIHDTYELLRDTGALVVFCVDPSDKKDSWYIYDYFKNVYENDLVRFPKWSEIEIWMNQNHFVNVSESVVERITKSYQNDDVFNDSFLRKHNSSQLASLSENEYQKGIEKIKTEIHNARLNSSNVFFNTNITFKAITGWK